jgi:hypothetical protein
MELYDIGFSSMFVMEARSLAQLALSVVNGSDKSSASQVRQQRVVLLSRADEMAGLIQSKLWDADRGIYANKMLLNGTLSSRIGPTSFYPMQAGIPSVEQAETMVTRWMANRSRFCISKDWPFEGSVGPKGNLSCYWGMPSIAADDETYCNGANGHCGYWRGHTWGPLSMLVYWGLSHRKYANSTKVTDVRVALVRQMREMLGTVWRENHHVCENYSPYKQMSENIACTGDQFYTWGGLTGMLSFLEAERGRPPPAAGAKK